MLLLLASSACRDPAPTDGPSATGAPSARLTRLEIGVPLGPTFDPDRGTYAVRASDLPDPIPLIAEPEDPAATVTVQLETVDGEVESGALRPLPDHRVRVTVTDGERVGRYVVGLLPDDFPDLHTEGDTGSNRWVMLANFDFTNQPPDVSRALLVVDGAGTPGWWRRTDTPSFDLRATRDGRLSWNGTGGPAGLEGFVVGPGHAEETRGPVALPGFDVLGDPHEFDVLDDGGALLIVGAMRDEDLTAWGGPGSMPVLHQAVEQLDPDGNLVFWWTTAGLLDYAELPDAVLRQMTAASQFEPYHLNSVEIDPDDGQWLISTRLSSQVLKVAREDGTFDGRSVSAGEVVWRLGGPNSDFVFVGDDRNQGWQGFSEQHCARSVGAHRIMVFDNGTSADLGAVGTARMATYELDTTTWTATLVDSHVLDGGGPTPAGGSVQRLPDGHTLIGWGSLQEANGAKAPSVTEIDADGREIWRLVLPDNQWTYRAFAAEGDPVDGLW
ncbi:MAG: aryl-sulfate sulfotransferase [Myxococcales bacterium]|nr:aryl-sulfate sulfotransferase [Myxococcales bacterium]